MQGKSNRCSSKPFRCIFDIKYRPLLLRLDSIVFQHTCILSYIFPIDLEDRCRGFGVNHVVIITVRAIFVTGSILSSDLGNILGLWQQIPVFKFLSVFPEALLALLTRKSLLTDVSITISKGVTQTYHV